MTYQQHVAIEAADLVEELVGEVRTNEPYVRDAIGPWARKPHGVRMQRHHTREAGLLAQLDVAAIPGGGQVDEDAPARGKPGSRPPYTAAFELSCQIVIEAAKLRRDLRTAAGRTLGARQHVGDDLHEVVGLIGQVDRETASEAMRQLRGWHRAARVLLGYDVRVATLGVVCPYCGATLRVKADASSDVWCPTPGCVDEEGDRHTWPRSSWLFLFDELGHDEASPAEPEEAHHG